MGLSERLNKPHPLPDDKHALSHWFHSLFAFVSMRVDVLFLFSVGVLNFVP